MDIVAVGLCGAVSYGCADFAGGAASRRIGLARTVAVVQITTFAATVAFALAQAVSWPALPAVIAAIAGGIASAGGLALLYRGFARGCIGVVAPSSGLVAVCVPVVADITLFNPTTNLQATGLALCAVSVVLLGAAPPDRPSVGTSLASGLLSGFGFGLADLAVGVQAPGDMLGVLCIVEMVATLCAVAGLAIPAARGGRPVGVQDRWPVVLAMAVGLVNAFGHQTFVAAAAMGGMALGAALIALHPLVSIVLGAIVMQERIGRTQWLGSVTSMISLALLAG
jgi:hypothetical protein